MLELGMACLQILKRAVHNECLYSQSACTGPKIPVEQCSRKLKYVRSR